MKYSIIIPCYCSENNLEAVITDIIQVLNQVKYEIILVNDYSKDQTKQVIKKICSENKNIIGLDLARNFGQHNAIMAGLHYVSGDVVVLMDDDGQTDPKQMFKLIEGLNEDVDVVYAKYAEKKHHFFRKIGTILNDRMACVLINKPKGIYLSSYIVMKRYVVEELKNYDYCYSYIDGLILRATSNIASVDIEHHERMSGESGYSFKKLLSLWVNGFTAFSIIPLRISIFFGVIFACVGFFMGGAAIINKLINPNDIYIGWSSIFSVITIIGGIILIVLGMIGEYVGRIFISLNKSPQFVVKEMYKGE